MSSVCHAGRRARARSAVQARCGARGDGEAHGKVRSSRRVHVYVRTRLRTGTVCKLGSICKLGAALTQFADWSQFGLNLQTGRQGHSSLQTDRKPSIPYLQTVPVCKLRHTVCRLCTRWLKPFANRPVCKLCTRPVCKLFRQMTYTVCGLASLQTDLTVCVQFAN